MGVEGLGLSRLTCKIKVDSHNEAAAPAPRVLNEILRQTMTGAADGSTRKKVAG